ncbi:ecto-NOX disulfide-thiol exchanger 2 isoform X3 [Lates japonicus]|uniref:Ecto-NOX disulfide-thiol exchanger 2 isoform X3 n=1 Tax=Lates japonicus TaxID=270547 RepID=A0AAD3RP15_LATJO|nr:ecto-NOX disulfide-thiol exchanger 2 isoform X3 [Lates japonicus]
MAPPTDPSRVSRRRRADPRQTSSGTPGGACGRRKSLGRDLPPPATRERPPGCKTVFVWGLTENATEQLIMEVFGQCGDITAIRKSKKNFCHIRFAEDFTEDKALFLSVEQIVSVFQAASKQKAWDHFSKAQRKNLDMWHKQAEEIRNMHNEQLMGIRREEEMEMSDDDMEDAPDSKDSEDSGVSQAEALKEENDSLRCQLDAYRNEVELLKQEQGKNQPIRSEEDSTHSQQLSFLQQALQGMQKILFKNKVAQVNPLNFPCTMKNSTVIYS